MKLGSPMVMGGSMLLLAAVAGSAFAQEEQAVNDKPFEYISENYVRSKVLFLMVHKDGLPPAIRQKLGL